MSRLPPGFTGFDVFDEPETPVTLDARMRLERKLGEYASVHTATKVLKKPLVDRYYFFNKARAWFIDAGDVDKAKAIKFGKRVQKQLKGRRTLTIDVPYLHYMPLYVGYGKEYVELPPLIVQASVIAMLDQVAEVLESRGKRILASVVDATANDLLEQRDDMLDWTGFDDVMKRSEDIADHISKERIEPWDVSELYNERPQ